MGAQVLKSLEKVAQSASRKAKDLKAQCEDCIKAAGPPPRGLLSTVRL